MISFSQFLQFIEGREGAVLNDPLLNLFNPIDLTWLTFAVIYLSVILFLFTILLKPFKLMLALQTYALMVIFRAVAMYLTPLNPPSGIILLDDPFVQMFGSGEIFTKDLFFSGHTATLFLLFLLTENKKLKFIFLTATLAVGACVLLQKVHYSIDVFAAFFFAFLAFRIIKYFHRTEMI
jgi:membrane-associated phospholipid phosphatase